MEQTSPIPIEPSGSRKKRPVFLTILCLFSFVYFFLWSALFLLATVYSGSVTEVVNRYAPEGAFSRTHILLIFLSGFIFHAMAFTGAILIWRLRRLGYFLLGAACLIIGSYQLSQPQISLNSMSVYIVLIILFGLFYRRLF